MKALIIDNDQDLLDVLTYALGREGYEVTSAADGVTGLDRLHAVVPDIVLVELRLPRLSGFEVCRRIRHASDVPIVIVTRSIEEDDVLRGLQLGADDYVIKPFSIKVLAARMQTVLRRCHSDRYERAASQVRVGDLVVDLPSHEVSLDGVSVYFTPIEFRILYMLAMNEEHVVPYARLVDYAWGYEGGDAALLKTHICHIRAKLGLSAEGDNSIRSLPTVGYALVKRRSAARPEEVTAPDARSRARDGGLDRRVTEERQLLTA
jgi:DNA-binding response OmpR family regulator